MFRSITDISRPPTMFLNPLFFSDFSSQVVFSSLWEVIIPFTRDFESIKTALMKLEVYDKTCLITALKGVKSVVLEEWGGAMPCQVLLITDGNSGTGLQSLKSQLFGITNGAVKDAVDGEDVFPLPFPFPCKLHVLCLSNPHDSTLQATLPLYQKLIDLNGRGGQVFVPEGAASLKTVQQMFLKLAEMYYKPFHGVLRCGNLMSHVSLFPPPEPYNKSHDFEWVKAEISTDIVICGFLDINDVASPPALTRHLVLPIPSKGDYIIVHCVMLLQMKLPVKSMATSVCYGRSVNGRYSEVWMPKCELG